MRTVRALFDYIFIGKVTTSLYLRKNLTGVFVGSQKSEKFLETP
jgi:hypothetical protein